MTVMVWACNCLAGKELPIASSRWTTPQCDPSRRNLIWYYPLKDLGKLHTFSSFSRAALTWSERIDSLQHLSSILL